LPVQEGAQRIVNRHTVRSSTRRFATHGVPVHNLAETIMTHGFASSKYLHAIRSLNITHRQPAHRR